MTISRWNERALRAALRGAVLALLGLGMAACHQRQDAVANDAGEAPAQADPADNASMPGNDLEGQEEAKKSILRPDIEPSPTPTPPADPIERTISFPAKGAEPDQAAMTQLDALAADPVTALGGPITIWGHSDSSGSDTSNLLASRHRAEAARDYLVGKGVAAERITIIAMGESRPIAPNRKLDGSDDPEGRARNRRVDIKVDLPKAAPVPHP